MELRRTGQYIKEMDNIASNISSKEMLKILKNMDDASISLSLSSTKYYNSIIIKTIRKSSSFLIKVSGKIAKNIPILSAIVFFADGGGINLGMADAFVPPFSWEMDRIDKEINSTMLDNPTWSFVKNWDEKYRGTTEEFPDIPLYLYYTTSNRTYNSTCQPTSMIITDKYLLEDILGYIPVYVFVGLGNELQYENNKIKLYPTRVAEIKY
ncbi:hypothetical protein [Dysgonomonas sp. 25]|uniref:hypothetical protein n=1 Tax=Dysgonomonas sp. 25 TaxID=2302933 RepID=UPI0013D3C1D4|nr:hypothetical protein [Dysgonomonas sp. 25]NDV70044.1 hypothetical protein [Dysgonomonas sp. 25]